MLIIPFIRKAETLQKDYLTDGVLDTALSFIETKKLIPALANMFVRISEAQGSRRIKVQEDEIQEVLQRIDYIQDLKLVQEAMDENNELETKKLIPALAHMFVRIRETQVDRRKTLEEDELQQILQQIDYIPDLKLAQEAMDQNNELKGLFDSLQNSTRRIWKLGLLHVIITLCIPASHWIPGGYDSVGMTTTIILAIITFLVALLAFRRFQEQMRQFLDLLKHNRQVG